MSNADPQKRIDELCDQYEQALRLGQPFDLKDCLQQVPADDQSQLLIELIDLEKELLPPQQLTDRRQKLRLEFPQFIDRIDACFAEEQPMTSPAGMGNSASTDSRPNQVGPYKLRQQIGQGGMGSVWLAEQSHPVRRQVALKIIRSGLDSQEVIARFEAERQALAMMDHPRIARILDAGTTEQGQPFFAMELVKGVPLTEYCDTHQLSLDARLKLFAQVCDAVQHAHQKGIIHRDLKPSNLLVAEYNGQAVPKVIDFGLAKALEATTRLTDKSLFTEFGQVLGTLKYMSPEQARLDSLDIDTRSDIYSLGAILYELLTGSTPLDSDTLKGQAILKVLELIREQDSPRPSSRLSTSRRDMLQIITQRRQTDVKRLGQILAGDLDWIVMKALDKDRTRRYDSASGFAADVQRYLSSEPVIARPPSLNYRVLKFVRKNRVGVLAASLVILALVGGIVGTSLAMFRARNAETRAEERQKEAELEREVAEARRLEAEQNLAYAKKGNEILGSVFAGLDPNTEYATVAELRNALRDNLENAVRELEGSAIGDPLAVAEMQVALGVSLIGLGQTSQAIELFERTLKTRTSKLGPDHPSTLEGMANLAVGYLQAGQLDRALPLLEQTLELTRAKLGPDHPHTLTGMGNLADGYWTAGQLDKALPLLEQTLELSKAKLGPNHLDTLSSMNSLARGYWATGQLDKALPLLEQTLELNKAILGSDHPHTLRSMNGLAAGYNSAGQLDKALPLFEQALELRKARLGPDNFQTLTSMNNLAVGYESNGQMDRALLLHEQTLELRKNKLGSDHPDTLISMNNLAQVYRNIGELDKALGLYEQTLELIKVKLGLDHPDTLNIMNNLAEGYRVAGQLDKALPLYESTLELMKNKLGTDHPLTLTGMNNLAVGYEAKGDLDKALLLYEQTLELRKARLGPDHPNTMSTMNNLLFAYATARQANQFEKLFLRY